MRPIQYRADVEFVQALRCVEYRLPKKDGFRPRAYLAALALRYGLMGAAATHYLLESTDSCDEPYVLESVMAWPKLIADHVSIEVGRRLGHDDSYEATLLLARWSRRPLQVTVPLYRRCYPLEVCLQAAIEDFSQEFEGPISEGSRLWNKRRAVQRFMDEAAQSARYALNFFDRRQHGLEEVPEIALLDE
ncbi:MAG: hypothetical protein ACAH95_05000 [Fimbriimonas sp.]